MAYRLIPFINGNFYHIFNRGVEKRVIFIDDKDCQRFIQTLYYYQFAGPKPKFSTKKRFRINKFEKNPKIVEIICFCLMPNHFHLLVRQLKDNGIQEFASKISNSYTKYFNTKYKRIGPLFQGEFKAVIVDSEEQLVHLSRYIHLNPYVAKIVEKLEEYVFSSYQEFTLGKNQFCNTQPILDYFNNLNQYLQFVNDYKDYARELKEMKSLLIEE